LKLTISCFDRVFSLERTAAEQKAEIYRLRDTNESLREQLEAAQDANRFGHEPTTKLINVIMDKNMELTERGKKNEALERRISELEEEISKEREKHLQAVKELEKSRKNVSFGPTSVTTFYKNSSPDKICYSSQSESDEESYTTCSHFSASSNCTLTNTDVLRIRKPLLLSKVPQRNSFNFF